jgi:hypothetical protein
MDDYLKQAGKKGAGDLTTIEDVDRTRREASILGSKPSKLKGSRQKIGAKRPFANSLPPNG